MKSLDELRQKVRREYYEHQSHNRFVLETAKTLLDSSLLRVTTQLRAFEKVETRGRLKEFDSVVKKLEGEIPSEGGIYTDEAFEKAGLRNVKDLVGLKVRVFPNSLMLRIVEELAKAFRFGKDPELAGVSLATLENCERLKYFVSFQEEWLPKDVFEIQVVPFIIDAYQEIEHDILYKRPEGMNKTAKSLMGDKDRKVIDAIKEFNAEFERVLESIPPTRDENF